MTHLRLTNWDSHIAGPVPLPPAGKAAGVWLALLLVVLGCGCGKKAKLAPAVAAPAAVTNTAQAGAGDPSASAPALAESVAAAPGGGADLKALNHAYIRWIVQSRRRVKTFEEFVAGSGIQVPPPPAGKKYVIDKAGFIALVNQ